MGVRSQKSQAEYRDLRHSSPFNNLWVANYLEYFPGGTSVVKTLPSSAGGAGSISDWEVKTPHAMWYDQKIKNK